MKFRFGFERRQMPSEMVGQLGVPSGTAAPLWIWSLVIICMEENRRGVIADLNLCTDKNGEPIYDTDVCLNMVNSFSPDQLRQPLLAARERAPDEFSRKAIDLYLGRLEFSRKHGECSDIGFVFYELCKNREEFQKLSKIPLDPRELEVDRNALFVAAAAIKLKTGEDLFR